MGWSVFVGLVIVCWVAKKTTTMEGDQGMLCGGYGEEKPATAEIQELLDKVSAFFN